MSVSITQLSRDDLASATQVGTSALGPKFSVVAEEKLFGTSLQESRCWAAWDGLQMAGIAVAGGRWIRLLAVAPSHRNRGYGSALLSHIENQVARHSSSIRTMDEPGNYLSPGIPATSQNTLNWFRDRGYREAGRNKNMVVELNNNRLLYKKNRPPEGYEVTRADAHETGAQIRTWLGGFSRAWTLEAERALQVTPTAVHVAMYAGQVIAFACHDGNNSGLGHFGPAATLDEHRGKGLGGLLLRHCLRDVAARQARCEIAWIGPQEFYERAVGARIDQEFIVMERDL